jgi:hypothetical protein
MRRFLVPVLFLALAACSESTAPAPVVRDPVPSPTYLYASDFGGANLGAKISSAIDALPASGGTVDATEFTGLQRVDRTVVLGSDTKAVELRLGPVTLSGSTVLFELHAGSKLVGTTGTVVTQDSAANLDALVTGTNIADCEIAHLTLDGNAARNTGPGSAISLHTAKRCWIHHLVVQNTVGALNPAIALHDEGNEDNVVEYNLVQDIGTPTNYADGIYVAGPGNKVLFNSIRRASDFGIVGEFCAGCVIEGNDITGVPAGIAVGSGVANHQAVGNVIQGNVVIGGNTSNWGGITVYLTNGVAPVATAVTGNVVRDVVEGHGIFLNGAVQVSLTGNLISNIAPTSTSYGIFVKDSRNVSISGGVIDTTGGFGIGIGRSANVAVDGVVITDAGRSSNQWSGIGLDAMYGTSTSISLTDNHIFDTQPIHDLKLMNFCIDFGQGGTTTGVMIGGNLFDDGRTANGCRNGTVNFGSATRVTQY